MQRHVFLLQVVLPVQIPQDVRVKIRSLWARLVTPENNPDESPVQQKVKSMNLWWAGGPGTMASWHDQHGYHWAMRMERLLSFYLVQPHEWRISQTRWSRETAEGPQMWNIRCKHLNTGVSERWWDKCSRAAEGTSDLFLSGTQFHYCAENWIVFVRTKPEKETQWATLEKIFTVQNTEVELIKWITLGLH